MAEGVLQRKHYAGTIVDKKRAFNFLQQGQRGPVEMVFYQNLSQSPQVSTLVTPNILPPAEAFSSSVCPFSLFRHTSPLFLGTYKHLGPSKYIKCHLPAHGIPEILHNGREPRTIGPVM